MKYINIPGTELKSAAIVMGSICSVEGSADEAYRILDMYRDAGGNMLDSANVYGKFFEKGNNICDKHIGNWMKLRGCRNEFIVETKGGHPDPKGNGTSRLEKKDIRKDLEESLRALQTDTIDLFFLHRDDQRIPAGEIMEYLNEFKKEGKIRHFGASNWMAGRILEGQKYAREHGLEGFVADQLLWSMADADMKHYPWPGCTNMDGEAWKMHVETGMAAFAYESQARGFFQKYRKAGMEGISEELKKLYYSDENINRYKRAQKLASEKNISLSAIVLLYVLSSPFPSAALIGPRTDAQFMESMEAADMQLSEDEMKYLFGK